MKKSRFALLGFILMISTAFATETESLLDVTTFTLDNGLTVYLNEDHTQSDVFGLISVKHGGKYDPTDATGLSHYLEHMLFKGTDRIGTIDFDAEQMILEDIYLLYDQLAATDDPAEEVRIQKEINRLAVEAAQYSVPNELNHLLKSMGGSRINAQTFFDWVNYFNSFPSTELEKWLDITVERFRNPVFRLFQSELETVFEEKNRAMDNMEHTLFNEFMGSFFKNHPYGQQTVLGTVDHIKNPSLTTMYENYHTYYVPNNMALILSGNFDSKKAMRLIKRKFSVWQKGDVPEYPVYPEEPFNGRELVTKRLTPIRVSGLAYRTVPVTHDDYHALQLIEKLLHNNEQTGLLDTMVLNNKLMFVMTFNINFIDHGGFIIGYAPLLVGQTFSGAERIIESALEKCKNEEISEELFNAVKQNMVKDYVLQLEQNETRTQYIASAFISGQEWSRYLDTPRILESITPAQIAEVATRYFGNDKLAFQSKVGFPKKVKLTKPDYETVMPKDIGKSEYARYLETISSETVIPDFVDFKNDLSQTQLTNGVSLLKAPNPLNDYCSFTIRYGIGQKQNPMLGVVASYLNKTGTRDKPVDEFKLHMSTLGYQYHFRAFDDYFIIDCTGPEIQLSNALTLINSLTTETAQGKKTINRIIKETISGHILAGRNPTTISRALMEYVIYDKNSYFFRQPSIAKLIALRPSAILASLEDVRSHKAVVTYTGNMDDAELVSILNRSGLFFESQKEMNPIEEFPRRQITDDVIYFIHDPRALQSQVLFLIEGVPFNIDDEGTIRAFNNYFGQGMSSLVFREIREFRSLAYSTGAYYYIPKKTGTNGGFIGYIGCQADKTIESIQVMSKLIDDMPADIGRFSNLLEGLIKKTPSLKPGFRNIATRVYNWQLYGYPVDPASLLYERYSTLSFNDIETFYKTTIKDKPLVLCIVGNKNRIDINELKKYGTITYIQKSDVYRF